MARFEFIGIESFRRHAHVLFLAACIRKAEVDEFNALIFDCLKYFFRGHIFFLAGAALVNVILKSTKNQNFLTSKIWSDLSGYEPIAVDRRTNARNSAIF
jgi:hypothetical protein